MTSSGDFGVYLHIPFCAHRCGYCAFATWSDRHHLESAYLEAVGVDIERAVQKECLQRRVFSSGEERRA